VGPSKPPEVRYTPRSPARAVAPFLMGLISFQVAHRRHNGSTTSRSPKALASAMSVPCAAIS
jgi:hypothetical protein